MTDRVGLHNLGNTCFLNVVLQSLRHCPQIVSVFLSSRAPALREKSNKKGIYTAFHQLLKDIWTVDVPESAHPSLIPRHFLSTLHGVLRDTDDDWYRPGQQCDSAEALQYILDSLHDATYHKVTMTVSGRAGNDGEISQTRALESWSSFFTKEYSPIVENFNGQTQIKVVCNDCGNISERYEPWLMIKAPIPGADVVGGPAPHMTSCLNAAFETETLDDYDCEKCKTKTRATLRHQISRLPPVVILSLKRFTNRGHKVTGFIPWDLDGLDFAAWMAFDRDPFRDIRAETQYKTISVIEHQGGTHGGHYRMYNRNAAANTWEEYDDASVRTVAPENVITPQSYIAVMIRANEYEERYADMRTTIDALRATGHRVGKEA
jgi:ubiquitin carboxyl-terminal hydrolase 8